MTSQQKNKTKLTKERQTAPTQRKTRSSKTTEAPAESPQLETQQTDEGELCTPTQPWQPSQRLVPGKNEKRKARPSFPNQPGKRVNAGIPPEPNGNAGARSVQGHESQPKVGAVAKSWSGFLSTHASH